MNNDLLYILLTSKINKNEKILNIHPDYINFENNHNIISERNIKIKNSSSIDNEKDNYDIIIFYDLFLNTNTVVNEIIEKSKRKLSLNGKIIFINNIVTNYSQYRYHPFSYLRCFYFGRANYIDDIFDEIRFNGLYVIDFDRLYTINLWSYPLEYFSIICVVK
jgi:hypothetical protein